MAYQKDICWTLSPKASAGRCPLSHHPQHLLDGHERAFWKLFTDDTTAAQALASFNERCPCVVSQNFDGKS